MTSHRFSTCSSDSSTITKIATADLVDATKRSNKWKSGLVYFMDPCIEDGKNALLNPNLYIIVAITNLTVFRCAKIFYKSMGQQPKMESN